MNGLAQAALVSAVVYIAAAPLELFFFSSPRMRALLHVGPTTSPTCALGILIGFRNLLAGIGAIVGFGHPVDRR